MKHLEGRDTLERTVGARETRIAEKEKETREKQKEGRHEGHGSRLQRGTELS